MMVDDAGQLELIARPSAWGPGGAAAPAVAARQLEGPSQSYSCHVRFKFKFVLRVMPDEMVDETTEAVGLVLLAPFVC